MIAVAFLTIACGCASAVSQPPPAVPLDIEYEIYSVLLDTIFSQVPQDTFYVHEYTSTDGSAGAHAWVPRTLRELAVSPELIEAYIAANADSMKLEPDGFGAQNPVVITSSSPGDIKVVFSRIGFNADGSEAVAHFVVGCGSRCGWGYVIRLENIGGTWVFKEGSRTIGL
jgi:hypothetical protein